MLYKSRHFDQREKSCSIMAEIFTKTVHPESCTFFMNPKPRIPYTVINRKPLLIVSVNNLVILTSQVYYRIL